LQPNCWAMNPETVEAKEPRPKATKKRFQRPFPSSQGWYIELKEYCSLAGGKKFRKKKIRPKNNNRRFVVNDMARINGKERRLTRRNRLSRWGF